MVYSPFVCVCACMCVRLCVRLCVHAHTCTYCAGLGRVCVHMTLKLSMYTRSTMTQKYQGNDESTIDVIRLYHVANILFLLAVKVRASLGRPRESKLFSKPIYDKQGLSTATPPITSQAESLTSYMKLVSPADPTYFLSP